MESPRRPPLHFRCLRNDTAMLTYFTMRKGIRSMLRRAEQKLLSGEDLRLDELDSIADDISRQREIVREILRRSRSKEDVRLARAYHRGNQRSRQHLDGLAELANLSRIHLHERCRDR